MSHTWAYIIIGEPSQITVTHKPIQRKSRPVNNPKSLFNLERKKARYYKVFAKEVSQISDDLDLTKDEVFEDILMAVIALQFRIYKW